MVILPFIFKISKYGLVIEEFIIQNALEHVDFNDHIESLSELQQYIHSLYQCIRRTINHFYIIQMTSLA